MFIDFGTIVAIMIVLISACFVIAFSIGKNVSDEKEIARLRKTLRKNLQQ